MPSSALAASILGTLSIIGGAAQHQAAQIQLKVNNQTYDSIYLDMTYKNVMIRNRQDRVSRLLATFDEGIEDFVFTDPQGKAYTVFAAFFDDTENRRHAGTFALHDEQYNVQELGHYDADVPPFRLTKAQKRDFKKEIKQEHKKELAQMSERQKKDFIRQRMPKQ